MDLPSRSRRRILDLDPARLARAHDGIGREVSLSGSSRDVAQAATVRPAAAPLAPPRVWRVRPSDAAAAAALEMQLDLHPVVARILAARGFDVASATRFLAPRLADLRPPAGIKDMDRAAARIVRALDAGERIRVHGDYDVDGQTSTATVVLFLRALGARVELGLSDRARDGYGLSMRAVEMAAAEGTTLLITCDCGVSNPIEIAAARDRGIDTVVIDHHRAPPVLPPAAAVLNPHQPGCGFEFKGLCAAGLAFYLCAGVRAHLRALGRTELPDLRPLLDVVTLGTIADVVPLADENRALVRHGLGLIAAGARPGIRALKRVASVPAGPVSATTVAFRLTPRLNAAGRVGDSERAVRLLVTEDEAEAEQLALELDQENDRRRAIEAENLDEAVREALAAAEAAGGDQVPAALVLASDRWHHGVVGIVAARIVERFGVPAAVVAMSDGVGRGSVRCPRGFHVYDALVRSGVHLLKYGGHAAAGGFSVAAERLDAFRAAFVEAAEEQLAGVSRTVELAVDAEVSLAEVDGALCHALEALGPFGEGNPEPVLAVRGARVAAERLLKQKHWLAQLEDGTARRRAIGFGLAARFPFAPGPVDVAFHAETNEWRGLEEVSLRVRDVRAGADAATGAPGAADSAREPA